MTGDYYDSIKFKGLEQNCRHVPSSFQVLKIGLQNLQIPKCIHMITFKSRTKIFDFKSFTFNLLLWGASSKPLDVTSFRMVCNFKVSAG